MRKSREHEENLWILYHIILRTMHAYTYTTNLTFCALAYVRLLGFCPVSNFRILLLLLFCSSVFLFWASCVVFFYVLCVPLLSFIYRPISVYTKVILTCELGIFSTLPDHYYTCVWWSLALSLFISLFPLSQRLKVKWIIIEVGSSAFRTQETQGEPFTPSIRVGGPFERYRLNSMPQLTQIREN